MALPTLSLPQFELTLPVSKQQVIYRPLLVKEEKLLYLAMLEEDPKAKAKAITQNLLAVLQSCVLTKTDVSKLPIVDFEYLFLKVKVASRGELSSVSYRCKAQHNDKQCNHLNELTINANDIEVTGVLDEKQNYIDCGGGIYVVMKYPSVEHLFNDTAKLATNEQTNEVEATVSLLSSFVDYFINGNDTITEFTREELINFFDGLPEYILDKFKTYYENLPKMELKVNFKCKQCGYDHKVKLDNIYDFFTQH